MAKYVIDETTLKKIANAIREATGETNEYTLTEMIAKTTALKDRILELEARPGPTRECQVVFHNNCEMYVRFEDGMTWAEAVDEQVQVFGSYCDLEGMHMYYPAHLSARVENGYIMADGCPNCSQGGGYILDSEGNRVLESDIIIVDEIYIIKPYAAYMVDEDNNIYELYFSPGDCFEYLEWTADPTASCHCGTDLWVHIDAEHDCVYVEECQDCGAPEMIICDGEDPVSAGYAIMEDHIYYLRPRYDEDEDEDEDIRLKIYQTPDDPEGGYVGVPRDCSFEDLIDSKNMPGIRMICPECFEETITTLYLTDTDGTGDLRVMHSGECDHCGYVWDDGLYDAEFGNIIGNYYPEDGQEFYLFPRTE